MEKRPAQTPTLRLTQRTEGPDRYAVEVAWQADATARRTATPPFDFKMTPQDHERLRWYLEDYLQYPFDPAPKIAAEVEKRTAELGHELFRAVFHADDDARDIWADVRDHLADTRVEVATGVREAAAHLRAVGTRAPPGQRAGRTLPRGPFRRPRTVCRHAGAG